jgi:apolipoprotein D and lipocalin family protein
MAHPHTKKPFSKAYARLAKMGLAMLGLALASCSTTSTNMDPPATAKSVDLKRYTGRWHEIARLPMPFQKAGESAIAEYGSNADGTISVHNIAVRPDGTRHDIRGYAKVLNPPENTRLAVRFNTWFGPLIPVPKEGNYWILHVDDRYQEAIVGTPDRKYLWLLARTSSIPRQRYAALVAKAGRLGFDVSRLIQDPHHVLQTKPQ